MNCFKWVRRLKTIKGWWGGIVASELMEENKFWKADWDRTWDEKEKLEDQIEKLEAELHKKENFFKYIGPGYWRVTENSLSRLDDNFIQYYQTHRETIQEKLEFTYVRPATKEENKRREERQRIADRYDRSYLGK